jgi:ABC-2 type transport system ATP-binding protein
VLRQSIDTLSKGYKHRTCLAQALIHDPEVLIMDEPTDGLDPNQKHEVRNLIREMARAEGQGGKAIVLSTHILEEVEAVCTRAIIIARGRVVADGTPAELMSRSRYHNAVTLSLTGAQRGQVSETLRSIGGVERLEMDPAENAHVQCTVFPQRGRAIAPAVAQAVRAKGWQVEVMRVETGRLEEVFRELTAPDKAAKAQEVAA